MKELISLVSTLLGNIIAGLFVTGKINDREKYGGLSQNPPNYPGHVFTGGRLFKFFFRGQQIFNRNFCFCYLLKNLFQFTVIDITVVPL